MATQNSYSHYFHCVYNKIRNEDFDSLREFSARCPEGPLLEIGAGTGRILRANLSRELYLLEMDHEMLEILRAETEHRTKVHVIEADAVRIPLQDRSISGCIIPAGTAHEIRPIFFVLTEIHRLLSRNGLLYLLVVNPRLQRPGTQGLTRKDQIGLEYSLSSTIDPSHDPYGYEVEFRIAGDGNPRSFFIKQSRPPIPIWREMLERAGFEIASMTGGFDRKPFDETVSSIVEIVAKKAHNPGRVMAPALRERYDGMATDYDNIIAKYNYRGKDWVEDFSKKYLPIHPTVLDLGCGNGLVGKALESCGKKPVIFGLDFSGNMVRLAKASGHYRSVAIADLSLGLPIIESRMFDVVTAFGVFEFVSGHKVLLKSIRSSLHIGGELWGTFEKGDGEFQDEKTGVKKYRYATIGQVSELLLGLGFNIIEIEERNAFHSPAFNVDISYFVFRAKRTGL